MHFIVKLRNECALSLVSFFFLPHFYLFPSNSIVPTLPSSDTNRHHCTHINTSKNRHLDHYITHPTIFIFFTYILLVSLFLQVSSHGYWWNLELGNMWSRKYERNQKKMKDEIMDNICHVTLLPSFLTCCFHIGQQRLIWLSNVHIERFMATTPLAHP